MSKTQKLEHQLHGSVISARAKTIALTNDQETAGMLKETFFTRQK